MSSRCRGCKREFVSIRGLAIHQAACKPYKAWFVKEMESRKRLREAAAPKESDDADSELEGDSVGASHPADYDGVLEAVRASVEMMKVVFERLDALLAARPLAAAVKCHTPPVVPA